MQDVKNDLSGIYFQTKSWQNTFHQFPELILIDATYKLNNLNMPLYVIMVVDGNEESEVVTQWLVANEDKVTISHLMDVFAKHNDTTKAKCIMADKDMVERELIAEKIPSAALMICLFHMLRTFRREITVEKMNLNAAQRLTVLEIIAKLAYARDEDDYFKHYQQLKETKLAEVIEYFDTNWHGIKEQWVEGLKRESCHYLNSTNNRLECINQKIKSVVSKHSSVLNFFEDLMKCLDSLALERDHRAAMIFKKNPVNLLLEHDCLSQYRDLLTPYAFSFVLKQFELSKTVKSTVRRDGDRQTIVIHSKGKRLNTSDCQCDCGFSTAMELPCRHIFSFRHHKSLDIFEASLCALRWTRDYYRSGHRVFVSSTSKLVDINVSTVGCLPTKKVLSQHDKYRKVYSISQKLANLASYIPTREFSYAVECLENIVNAWAEGKRVTVQVVDASSVTSEGDNLTDNDDPLPNLADNLSNSDHDELLSDLADNLSYNDEPLPELTDNLSDNDEPLPNLADNLSDGDELLSDLADNLSYNDEPLPDLADNLSYNDESLPELTDSLSDNDEPLPNLADKDILSPPTVGIGGH